jgi:putative transposase
MIRTVVIPCKLPTAIADAFNLESGRIYTQVLVQHYRIYRKKGIWLSPGVLEKLSDFLNRDRKPLLHAHSIDAAQQGFPKACKTARESRKAGLDVAYPHKRKRFRTTIWKNTAIRRKGDRLELSTGKGNPKINIAIPTELQDVLRFLEVRLVYDKKAKRYDWHLVVENGKQPKDPPGNNVVSVDLGEVHPAVIGDEQEATIITCRARRHAAQGHRKRLASLTQAVGRKTRGSRRYKRQVAAKTRLKVKHDRVMRDIEHKLSRAIVDTAVERQASIIAIGDVRDAADKVDLGKQANQKISGWNHGKVRQYVEYKAQAEGIKVELVDERHSSQTCPHCNHRHKPRGRIYCCPACRFQSHRDVVGQINILSRYRCGEVGRIPAPPIIKHRIPHNLRVMRRRRDTGQSFRAVAHGLQA